MSVRGSLLSAANVYHFCLGGMASRDDRRHSATANSLSLEARVQLVLSQWYLETLSEEK